MSTIRQLLLEMCMKTEEWVIIRSFGSSRTRRSTRSKVRVHRLMRKGCQQIPGMDMVLRNVRLFLENQSIFEENEKLRKKADLLYQENLVLVSELQKKFPPLGNSPSAAIPLPDSAIRKK